MTAAAILSIVPRTNCLYSFCSNKYSTIYSGSHTVAYLDMITMIARNKTPTLALALASFILASITHSIISPELQHQT